MTPEQKEFWKILSKKYPTVKNCVNCVYRLRIKKVPCQKCLEQVKKQIQEVYFEGLDPYKITYVEWKWKYK